MFSTFLSAFTFLSTFFLLSGHRNLYAQLSINVKAITARHYIDINATQNHKNTTHVHAFNNSPVLKLSTFEYAKYQQVFNGHFA